MSYQTKIKQLFSEMYDDGWSLPRELINIIGGYVYKTPDKCAQVFKRQVNQLLECGNRLISISGNCVDIWLPNEMGDFKRSRKIEVCKPIDNVFLWKTDVLIGQSDRGLVLINLLTFEHYCLTGLTTHRWQSIKLKNDDIAVYDFRWFDGIRQIDIIKNIDKCMTIEPEWSNMHNILPDNDFEQSCIPTEITPDIEIKLNEDHALIKFTELNNNLIACCFMGGNIKIWDHDYKLVGELKHETVSNIFMCGENIISASDSDFKIWNIKSFECIKKVNHKLDSINGINFYSYDTFIIAVSWISESKDAKCITFFNNSLQEYKSVKTNYFKQSFAKLSDGKHAMIEQNYIKIFDTDTINILGSHDYPLWIVIELNDGRIASVDEKGIIKIWH